MNPTDSWTRGEAYERYIGRWSRPVAAEFLAWLNPAAGLRWADIGCGTGALTEAILARAAPLEVKGFDLSADFVAAARLRAPDPRAGFTVADAMELPAADGSVDVAVSGLALNFVPDAARALDEMRRIVAPGGSVALYVWDYAEGMELIRRFWDAAVELDPAASALDEATRFPLCARGPLQALLEGAGLSGVEVREIVVPTRFASFAELWQPFEGGQGPAPGYVASLDATATERLRRRIHDSLPRDPGGAIPLRARAWAARGRAP